VPAAETVSTTLLITVGSSLAAAPASDAYPRNTRARPNARAADTALAEGAPVAPAIAEAAFRVGETCAWIRGAAAAASAARAACARRPPPRADIGPSASRQKREIGSDP